MARRLTKKGFREWLEAHEPDTVVGCADDTHECPLARFTGKPFRGYGQGPEWAESFAAEADYEDEDGRITAKRALEILDSL